jgi:uncharacterized protein YbbC (DUF1343 family)
MMVTDRDVFRAVDLGVVRATTLHRLYGKEAGIPKMLKLTGDRPTVDAIVAGKKLEEIRAGWADGLRKFGEARRPYLLYPR